MPLPFEVVCDLLEECHDLAVARKSHASAVEAWFRRHRGRVDAHDTSAVVLLSTLLPEKRSDRVYCIQAPRLEKVIGRGLSLGSSRIADLARYREPGNASDLADCVERVLNTTPMHFHKDSQVTVEEIDETLHGYASNMKWSSPSIRSQTSVSRRNQRDLELLYQRFTPKEGKWFTRLVLKSYQPLCFDSFQIYRLCDPVLPSVLSIREDFESAINALQSARSSLLPNTARGERCREQILAMIKPQLGTKIGRQHWMKGRSIGHCLNLGHGRMSVEEKIDGEYCQIHVDLSKGGSCVQIFSKSGKDSTEDKEALHSIIKDSLRVRKPECLFSQGCIVEGEIVVYDDQSKRILPFHKIRNHVARRGRFMDTEKDELPTAYEHVMIIYYDVLMLDKQSLLNVRHSERFKVLKNLVECQPGWAELVPRRIIDFGSRMAASDLRNVFAKTITSKQEGLVLKPDEPYFDFSRGDRPIGARCIKLKKEYIGNFGDIGDFAVVGAGYDPAKAKGFRIPHLQWTHFYVGTLNNKEKVQRWRAKPEFTVTNLVELNEALLKSVVQLTNPRPVPREENTITELFLPTGVEKKPRMTVAFTNPLVFDMRCFSFDKEGNTGFWTPRFPAVTKVHFDRDFTDCLSFEQLQELALENATVPDLPDSQENLEWIARLEGADPRRIAVDAESEGSYSTMPTPSPRASTQSTASHSQQSAPHIPVSTLAPIVSKRSAVSARPTKAFATPGPQLVTPPTSSAPEEATEQQTTAASRPQPCKRPQPTVSSSRTSPKRPRINHTPTIEGGSQTKRRRSSSTRRPLSEIDANNSQASPSTANMTKFGDYEVIDLTDSPEQSFAELPAVATGPILESGASSQESGLISVFPLDEENDEDEVLSASVPSKDPECQLAGASCQFSNTCIILSQCLTEPPAEVGALLNAHGLNNATMSVDEWLETYGKLGGLFQHKGVPEKTIVLVESLEQIPETERTLKALDKHRSEELIRRKEWITAYDWRVLRYMSIAEDDSVTQKYYDGFTDPWLRWFCGLV